MRTWGSRARALVVVLCAVACGGDRPGPNDSTASGGTGGVNASASGGAGGALGGAGSGGADHASSSDAGKAPKPAGRADAGEVVDAAVAAGSDAGLPDARSGDSGATPLGPVTCADQTCADGEVCCIVGHMFDERSCQPPSACAMNLRSSCESSRDCGGAVCCLSGELTSIAGRPNPINATMVCSDDCGPESAEISCAGAGDCPDGLLCCNTLSSPPPEMLLRLERTECLASCEFSALCRDDTDCPNGRCDVQVGASTGHRLCMFNP